MCQKSYKYHLWLVAASRVHDRTQVKLPHILSKQAARESSKAKRKKDEPIGFLRDKDGHNHCSIL